MVSGWLHMSMDLHGRKLCVDRCMQTTQSEKIHGPDAVAMHNTHIMSHLGRLLSLLLGDHACVRIQADVSQL
jgi:hypothetical protein